MRVPTGQFDATAEAVRKREEARAWTQTDELLASLIEIVHALYAVTLKANGSKAHVPPLRVPRPGDAGRVDAPAATHADMHALAAGR